MTMKALFSETTDSIDKILKNYHTKNSTTLDLSYVSNPEIDFGNFEIPLNVKGIIISHRRVKNLYILSALKHLCSLTINNAQLEDLSPLSELKELKTLHLNNNLISELQPLCYLDNLTYLTLDNNNIENLNPLYNLKLKTLSVDYNKIVTLDAISEILSLEILSASHNEITDFKVLEWLPKLYHLSLNNNKIKNMPFSDDGFQEIKSLGLDYNNIESVPCCNYISSDKCISISIQGNPIAINIRSLPNVRGLFLNTKFIV